MVAGHGPAVNVTAAGFPVHAFAQGALEEVTDHLTALPAVTEAYATTGSSDVLCKLAACPCR
ncbi:Lrp/AsnC ligand binding domain-containing protein [Streptomyces milbemycinicus]|uniref:Lrp/AsnC ligand binding domain-containing protein n=1 Tax=Streptomyces milbemycinicus TaxID=476552 RepID=UPI0033F045E2